jgi:hypothetical protein
MLGPDAALDSRVSHVSSTEKMSPSHKIKEQCDLGFRGQVADFVEENRAAVGGFESSQTSLERAREGALLVAKEFRRDERGWDRRAIHPNECARGSMRPLMNGSRDQFFAAAGFARD